MALQFVVIDGADEGRIFPLNEGPTVIGNSRKNTDICLHDLLMSRVHCEVQISGDHVVVKDEENSTGTLVNGQKVAEQELHIGDVIRIGNSYLRLSNADAAPPEAAASPTAPPAPETPGKLPHLPFERLEELAERAFGHYKLDAVLGRGHSGVVFRAEDLKANRVVALKVFHPDFPKTEQEMQRFVQVMKTMLPLRHPHLVAYWGAGKAGPYCWTAMELVEGESMTQVLQRTQPDRKIPWQRAFRACAHVGRALEYVQKRQLFHGNITPQNILVQSNDKTVKLADLMLNQALEGSTVQAEILEKKLLAELPYLAPEQTQADAFVDRLSDIYSLGVITYHLLTGHKPFAGDTVEDTIALIQEEGPPVRPRKFQKAIPEQLERIVLRMLVKHQEDRYQSAAELLEDLDRVAEQEELPV